MFCLELLKRIFLDIFFVVGYRNEFQVSSRINLLMPKQLLMKKKAVGRIVFLKVVWLTCITLVIL